MYSRMPAFGRDPAVDRLAHLGNDHQIVDPAPPQRPNRSSHGAGNAAVRTAKQVGNFVPSRPSPVTSPNAKLA